MNLQTSLSEVDRILKMYARRLEHLGIVTVEDLLFYIPFRYDDYRVLSKIQMLQPGEVVTVQGKVLEIKNQYTRSRKTIQKAILVDDTGEIELTWFNQPFLTRVINPNDILAVSGRVEKRNQTLSMLSPEYEVVRSESGTLHTGRLVPVYSETKGITSKWIRRQVHKVLEMYATDIDEYLPEEIIAKHRFLSLQQAIRTIHFPKTLDEVAAARKRIAFDELFLLQLKAVQRKETWKKNTVGIPFVLTSYQTKLEKFIDSLPFTLTSAQQKAVDAITQDLTKKEPMNRLLQGDVGSGKTVVSTIAMYLSYLNGYQSVLMAPTEILAQQHYTTISKLLTQFGVKVDLVTGSIKYLVSGIKKKKENIQNTKYQIQDTHVLVGTHAVLSEKIIFDKLGLVVIDEQQRFGVEQRSIIREKGKNPHLLTMTATPIPRTVALTMYGDLDLSYLDEMPKGRQMIKTWLVPQEKRDSAYVWIRKQVKETDSQIFIICPFIEESESMQTVKAATKEFERLAKDIFPDLKLGMLHGRLKGKEKDAILDKFRQKEFDILVATPVVEVGIDITNATVMVIEAAERFGLAQLHQLRGRVGRGDKQSYCLLFTETPSDQVLKRLKAMESMHVGAELAELDLKLRGPGDVFGTMQHGLPKLKVASFSDVSLIEKAKNTADILYPKLEKYPKLKEKLAEIAVKKVSPD